MEGVSQIAQTEQNTVELRTKEYVVLRTMDNIDRWPEGGTVEGDVLLKIGFKHGTLQKMINRKLEGKRGITNLTAGRPIRFSQFDNYEVKQYLLNRKHSGPGSKTKKGK